MSNRSNPPPYARHDWGTPGIQIDPPLNSQGKPPGSALLEWTDLKFNPLGLYDLRRHLGVLPTEPGIFTAFQGRFEAADYAWLAAGTSTDGRHRVQIDRFFTEQLTLRSSLPFGEAGAPPWKTFEAKLKTVIWDLATMWDRAYGGTTLILHADGPIAPNTPQHPKYFKASAYLPPVFVAENPNSHLALAHIAQTFIEHVGIPTSARWRRAGRIQGYFGTGPVTTPPRAPYHATLLVPIPSQTNYVFLGRPRGDLALLPTPSAAAPAASPPPSSSQEYGCDDLDDTTLAALDYQEQIYELQTALAHERSVNQRLEEIALDMQDREREWKETEEELRAEVARLKAQVGRGMSTPRPQTRTLTMPPPPSPSTSRALARSTTPSPSPYSQARPPASLSRPSPFSPERLAGFAVELGTVTDAYLTSHDLDAHRSAVSLIVRRVSPVKFHEEVARLELPPDLKAGLIDALSADYVL
ncbi:hypothetical protein DFH06DRAFT_1350240 [Mycena polygramma]|nr:hypothetical protein DFH06DRAFT_1350240 [Mycena polygramma]